MPQKCEPFFVPRICWRCFGFFCPKWSPYVACIPWPPVVSRFCCLNKNQNFQNWPRRSPKCCFGFCSSSLLLDSNVKITKLAAAAAELGFLILLAISICLEIQVHKIRFRPHQRPQFYFLCLLANLFYDFTFHQYFSMFGVDRSNHIVSIHAHIYIYIYIYICTYLFVYQGILAQLYVLTV